MKRWNFPVSNVSYWSWESHWIIFHHCISRYYLTAKLRKRRGGSRQSIRNTSWYPGDCTTADMCSVHKTQFTLFYVALIIIKIGAFICCLYSYFDHICHRKSPEWITIAHALGLLQALDISINLFTFYFCLPESEHRLHVLMLWKWWDTDVVKKLKVKAHKWKF